MGAAGNNSGSLLEQQCDVLAEAQKTTEVPIAAMAAPLVLAQPAAPSQVPLIILATTAAGAVMWLARPVLVPMVIGILITYALDPLQRRLVKWHVPPALAAALLLAALVAAGAEMTYVLADQASAFAAEMPRVARQIRKTVETARRSSGPTALEKVETAANELKDAATSPVQAAPRPGVARVQIEAPRLQMPDLLWQSGLGALELAGQAALVVFLAFYLLRSGDLYKRKIVRHVPSLTHKKITVEILNDIDRQIERFLITRTIVSVIVGGSTALVLWPIGLNQPAIWGVAAGVLNIFPYVGPTAVTIAATAVAYLQFGTVAMALAVGGATAAVATLEGFVVTPWLMGRAGGMSSIAILVGVAVWGWIWGVSGLFLAVPILMVAKAICDHAEGLKMFGDLLAD